MTFLNGLIAATYTPLHQNGDINPAEAGPLAEHLLRNGVKGLYVCGSTGEGMSLSTNERMTVAEEYVRAADGRVPVIVQVGHNSLTDAQRLASHALKIGATAISATCPSYFRIADIPALIQCMESVASAAPDLPFYYYHIPAFTGSTIDVFEFLNQAGDRIPNLAGMKYTDSRLHDFQVCLEMEERRFDVVWGCDEMLLGALATGARAAIGSTYNIAAPLYRQLLSAFDSGDLREAQRLQLLSVRLIRSLNQFPFHAAMKAILEMEGFPVGPCRLPQINLSESDVLALRNELDWIGFHTWKHGQFASPDGDLETSRATP